LLPLKFLPLDYYHSRFLAATFDFTYLGFLGLHPFSNFYRLPKTKIAWGAVKKGRCQAK